MPPPGIKKINDLGVFGITAIASVFAYVWLYLCLGVMSKDEITPVEAWLTLGFFFILVTMAFIADKINARRMDLKEHNIPPYSFT